MSEYASVFELDIRELTKQVICRVAVEEDCPPTEALELIVTQWEYNHLESPPRKLSDCDGSDKLSTKAEEVDELLDVILQKVQHLRNTL